MWKRIKHLNILQLHAIYPDLQYLLWFWRVDRKRNRIEKTSVDLSVQFDFVKTIQSELDKTLNSGQNFSPGIAQFSEPLFSVFIRENNAKRYIHVKNGQRY